MEQFHGLQTITNAESSKTCSVKGRSDKSEPVVGVASSAVPVSLDGLGVQRQHHSCNLGDPLQDVARSPQLVGGSNADGRADLELPLSGHHLAVDAADLDAGVQASLVVSVHDVTAPGLVRPGSAVVRPLWAGVPANRPSKRPLHILLQQSVLLLQPVPATAKMHKSASQNRQSEHTSPRGQVGERQRQKQPQVR
jgi:hypothetical protein